MPLGPWPQVLRGIAYPGKLPLPVERDVARGTDEQRDPLVGIDVLDDPAEDEHFCMWVPVKIEQHEVVAASLEENSRFVEGLGRTHINAVFAQHPGARVPRGLEAVYEEDSFSTLR